MLVGYEVLVIREIEGIHPLRMTFDEGRRMPLYAGATSRILMAHLSVETQDQVIALGLKRWTQNTIMDPVKLKREMAKVRKDGVAHRHQPADSSGSDSRGGAFGEGRDEQGLHLRQLRRRTPRGS